MFDAEKAYYGAKGHYGEMSLAQLEVSLRDARRQAESADPVLAVWGEDKASTLAVALREHVSRIGGCQRVR